MFRASKKWRMGCAGLIGLIFLCGVISRFAPNQNKSTLPTTNRQIQAVQVSTNTALPVATALPTDTPLPAATTESILVATAIPAATDPPVATPLADQQVLTLFALDNANLRSGPGTDFAVSGHAAIGQPLNIIGHNADSSWYQLADQSWIAAFLAGSADAIPPAPTWTSVPQSVVEAPTAAPVVQPVSVEAPTPAPVYIGGSTCADGTHSNSTGRGTCSHHGGIKH